MKLVVVGSTGFIGAEVIRQALRNPSIHSVIGLGRTEAPPPKNIGNPVNLDKYVVLTVEQWIGAYHDSVMAQIKGVDACIWCQAVVPSKSADVEFAQVSKVCYDYVISGIENMASVANKPFRFVYLSGVLVERDQSKSLPFLAEYRHLRGCTETSLLEYAAQHAPDIEVTAAKPGFVVGPGREPNLRNEHARATMDIYGPSFRIHVSEIAAAMVEQCLNGITKDPLLHEDLVELGQRTLREEDYMTEK